jgi:hypothetical protein
MYGRIICVTGDLFVCVQSMSVVHTVDEKNEVLKLRKEEQCKLGRKIDLIIAQGKSDEVACGGAGVCPALGRRVMGLLGLQNRSSQRLGGGMAQEISTCAPTASRIFRAVKKPNAAASKLQGAASAMRDRLDTLETRASESRASATRAMTDGQKSTALRELKRSKAYEKQMVATQMALDTLETHSDLLEQTELQKTVASAIGATAKSLKKQKNILSKAEDVVDTASEMRDLHDDLTNAMSSLGANTNADLDDDELLSELELMSHKQYQNDADAVQVPSSAEVDRDSRMYADKASLEAKHVAYDQLEAVRSRMPAAPKSKAKAEKVALLTS